MASCACRREMVRGAGERSDDERTEQHARQRQPPNIFGRMFELTTSGALTDEWRRRERPCKGQDDLFMGTFFSKSSPVCDGALRPIKLFVEPEIL